MHGWYLDFKADGTMLTSRLSAYRLQLASGIDLTGPVDSVIASMQQKIKGVDSVTHVIFTAYIEKPDFGTLRTVNTHILKTAITALDRLAQNLQSVVLQTGGKAYGVEFSDKLEIKPPLKVSVVSMDHLGRIVSTFSSSIRSVLAIKLTVVQESQPRIPRPCRFSPAPSPCF